MSPTTKVTVGGVKGRVTLEAIIDTGFDGDICIPVKTATELGLELVGQDEFELADAAKNEDSFSKDSRFYLARNVSSKSV